MEQAAKQRLNRIDIGEGAYIHDLADMQNGNTYMSANGCEITARFASTANDQIVNDVLSILLHESYREECV